MSFIGNLTLDMSKVVKAAQMIKKGNIFNQSKKIYVYLEGDLLKYGKSELQPKNCMDLKNATVQKDKKFKTQFKVKTSKLKLRLKASSEAERDQWYDDLSRIAGGSGDAG
jgi:hypothetical protein